MDINILMLSARSHNALTSCGITTTEQLIELNWKQLNSIDGLGGKGVSEVCWGLSRLINGDLVKLFQEFDREWRELREKAQRYDEIVKITSAYSDDLRQTARGSSRCRLAANEVQAPANEVADAECIKSSE